MTNDAAICKVAHLLYQKEVDLIRFQFNARCEGGVTGLIWNDDVKEYYNAERIAFRTLYLSTPWSIRLRYAEYGIRQSRIVYSVVDHYALSFLEFLNKENLVPQCPKCNRFYDEKFGCEEHYQEQEQAL